VISFRLSFVARNSQSVQIPEDLGTRLRALFCLGSTPKSLSELVELIQEHNGKCVRDSRLKIHFQAVNKGEEIFGHVDYETRHKIKLADGRQFFIACALDALVEGFFLPIEIDSICFHCGQTIRVRMFEGTIKSAEPSSAVMWLGASKEGKGSCGADLCPYINFFSSPQHIAEWKDKNPDELGIMLTLPQSLELARKGFWEPIHHPIVKTRTRKQ